MGNHTSVRSRGQRRAAAPTTYDAPARYMHTGDPLTDTQGYRAGIVRGARERWADRAKDEANATGIRLSDDEVQAAVRRQEAGTQQAVEQMVNRAHVYVAMQEGVLAQILGQGRFRSYEETRTSGGSTNTKGSRTAMEEVYHNFPYPETRYVMQPDPYGAGMRRQIFDIEGERPDPRAAERPIYGYLSPGRNGAYGDVVQYGTVRVRLADRIKGRTTFTVGDSLDTFHTVAPSPVLHPSWVSAFHAADGLPPASNSWAHVGRYSPSGEWLNRGQAHIPYVEAQVHGGVHTRDIAEVVFTRPPTADLVDALRQRQIPFRIIG